MDDQIKALIDQSIHNCSLVCICQKKKIASKVMYSMKFNDIYK